MPLSVKKWGTSAAYGLVDILTEYIDQTKGYSATGTFKNTTDWLRVAAVGGGAVASYLDRGSLAEYGETVTYSATPLLEKSAANFILRLLGSTRTFRPGLRPRVVSKAATGPGAASGVFY
jgi:hypothetical protein